MGPEPWPVGHGPWGLALVSMVPDVRLLPLGEFALQLQVALWQHCKMYMLDPTAIMGTNADPFIAWETECALHALSFVLLVVMGSKRQRLAIYRRRLQAVCCCTLVYCARATGSCSLRAMRVVLRHPPMGVAEA